MNCLKIIPCYFGDRRSQFNTPKNMEEYILKMIENEISIENGIDTDVIFVNNISDNQKLNSLINSYNNTITKNGKIIVEDRENINGSFGAYYDMFFKYNEKYDYYFFCEDDVLIYKQSYILEFINFLNSDINLGFVCLAPISNIYGEMKKHSGGGCGLTSREKFLKVYSEKKVNEMILNISKKKTQSYHLLQQLEIEFTSMFIRNGFKIENHPKFSPLCDNYERHSGQKTYTHLLKNNEKKEFIYKVGN